MEFIELLCTIATFCNINSDDQLILYTEKLQGFFNTSISRKDILEYVIRLHIGLTNNLD
jgi:hypothetical protein